MEKSDDFYGTFEFKPLEKGYGVTIGNASISHPRANSNVRLSRNLPRRRKASRRHPIK